MALSFHSITPPPVQSLGGASRLPWQHRAHSNCSQEGRVPSPLHCHPCLPTQHLLQPACPQLYSLPSKCTHHTHATWTSLSLPESVGTVAAAGARLRAHPSPLVAYGELGQPSPAGGCLSVCLRVSLGTILGIPSNAATKQEEAGTGATMGRHEGSSGASPLCLPLCGTSSGFGLKKLSEGTVLSEGLWRSRLTRF